MASTTAIIQKGTHMPDPSLRPARQWRITITEQPRQGTMLVALTWRTFPSAADRWDGARYCQQVACEPPIRSAEDLEAVLAAAVDGDWWESVRSSYPRRV